MCPSEHKVFKRDPVVELTKRIKMPCQKRRENAIKYQFPFHTAKNHERLSQL